MAQKTIDFENDILRPIGSLKRGLADLNDNKITKFYTNNNGDTVLNDSDDGKIQDLVIYGKSEQKQYKGTNLAINHLSTASVTVHGITFTVNEDKSVTLNGTSDMDNIDYYLVGSYTDNIIATLDVDKDYTIRAMPQNTMLACGTKSSTQIIGRINVHTKGFPIAFIFIRIEKSGTTFNNVTIYPQINEGTTLLDYEPYTGGKPSPSPEYPQEIKAVVNPVIKTHGVNILDIKDIAETVDKNNGLTYSVQKGIIKIKGTSKQTSYISVPFLDSIQKKLVANNTYIFNPNSTKKKETSACYLDFSNNVNLGLSVTNDNTDKPVNVQESNVQYTFTLTIKFTKDTKIDMEWKPQLLLSNTLLPYQPYQETQATLPYELYAIPVSSGGNVTIDGQQYIADYVDVEKGVLVRNVKKMNIDSYTWKLNEETVGTVRTANSIFSNTTTRERRILSNKFINLYSLEGFDRSWTNKIYNVTSGNLVMLLTYGVAVTDEQWSEIKDGLIILYRMENSKKINLTQDQIEAFKTLSTYYPKTYINAESEQLDAYTMFNYPVSMEKGWEYVKQQIGDTRKYVYDMDTKTQDIDTQSAEAYVNSEYAVALTELEV